MGRAVGARPGPNWMGIFEECELDRVGMVGEVVVRLLMVVGGKWTLLRIRKCPAGFVGE